MSLHNWPLMGEHSYIGLDNYWAILRDTRFWNALRFTGWYTLVVTIAIFAVAFPLAIFIERPRALTNVYRTAFFMAFAVSGHRHRHQARLQFEALKIEKPGTVAKAVVGFLQGDDIGTDFADDARGAFGIEFAVGADAFVDVVGGDHHLGAVDPLARRRLCLPRLSVADRQEHGLREGASVYLHGPAALFLAL